MSQPTLHADGVDRQDTVRRVVITVALLICIAGSLVGSGVIGPVQVNTAENGAFAEDSTLLTPAGSAFSIWSVVYAGLALFTLWQWFTPAAALPRHRRIGWWAAASMVLNAAWLTVSLQGWLWASVVVIVLLLWTLVMVARNLGAPPSDMDGAPALLERVLTDGTFGLYLGWVSLATVANVAVAAVGSGAARTGGGAETVAAVVLVGVALVAVLMARTLGARVAVAAAQSWGLAWIAYNRLEGDPSSTLVGWVAVAAAVAPVLAVAALRARRPTMAGSPA